MPSASGGTGGEAIGTIIARPSNRFTSDAEASKYLYCDGSTFSAAAYPKLYQILGKTTLPDLRERFLEGFDVAGTYIEAGLPNITAGYFIQWYSGSLTHVGALYVARGSGGSYLGEGTSYTDHLSYFNAARCSSIYGKSTTVQPPAFTVRYYIRAK